jgi:hypothetical protein
VPTRIPASERTSQKLDALLTQGVADGDARTELLKLAVRKIVEEALEAEVAEAVGRGLCFARTSSDSLVTIRHPRATGGGSGTGRPASSECRPRTCPSGLAVGERERAGGRGTPFGGTDDRGG